MISSSFRLCNSISVSPSSLIKTLGIYNMTTWIKDWKEYILKLILKELVGNIDQLFLQHGLGLKG